MNKIITLLKDKDTKDLAFLAFPIMIQGVFSTLMGFVDNLMVGQLGESVISGVGNSFQIMVFVTVIFSAVNMGGSVVVAQYFGAENKKDLKDVVGTILTLGWIIGIGVSVLFYFG
jgi:Na+-driven multidrug efflux pump